MGAAGGAISDQESQHQGGGDSLNSTNTSDNNKDHDSGGIPSAPGAGIGGSPFAPTSPATGLGGAGSTIDPSASFGSGATDPGTPTGTPPCSGPTCASLSGPIGANGDKTEGTDDGVTEKGGSTHNIRMPKSAGIVGIQGPGPAGFVPHLDTDPVPGIDTTIFHPQTQ